MSTDLLMPPEAQAIAIRHLGFRWRADRPPVLALDTLEIRPGERVFIEGPSGSGKTTLLGLLAGVLQVDDGTLDVLGQPLHRLGAVERDRFRADHVGYVFQMFNLIPYLSMVENVALPCRFSRRRRSRALARGGNLETEATRLLDHLDLGDPALRTRLVTELSVGQQQRVAAARALMGAPEILIADEPTSALDAWRQAAFLDLLLAEARAAGSSVLFVSHDLALADHFERTLELAA